MVEETEEMEGEEKGRRRWEEEEEWRLGLGLGGGRGGFKEEGKGSRWSWHPWQSPPRCKDVRRKGTTGDGPSWARSGFRPR